MQLQQLPHSSSALKDTFSPRKKAAVRNSCEKGKPDFTAMSRHYALTGNWQLFHKSPPPTSALVVFLVDSSGSMLRNRQISGVKGLISQTVTHYRHQDIRFALVVLTENAARIAVPPSSDGNVLVKALENLPSGGKTNLKAGLELVHQLLKHARGQRTELCMFTDGRINAGTTTDPFAEATSYFRAFLKTTTFSTVTDTESGLVPLKLAAKFARETGCIYRTFKSNAV